MLDNEEPDTFGFSRVGSIFTCIPLVDEMLQVQQAWFPSRWEQPPS